MTRVFTHTDSWHPTVNPSARMAVHHYRFRALLHQTHGLLNEVPRRRGGTTLRVVRFDGHGGFQVIALPGTLGWAPWWLPATSAWAAGLITRVYDAALTDPRPTPAEKAVYGRVRDQFAAACGQAGTRTIGETLHGVLDAAHRELDPDLPRLDLVSLTRSPARHPLAWALGAIPGGLTATLARWADAERQPVWGLLAVGASPQGVPLRLRFRADPATLELEPLDGEPAASRHPRPQPVTADAVIELLHTGRLLPGSRLVALAETTLASQGWQVRHFGNTYGRTTAAAQLTTAGGSKVITWPDDTDAWHFADLNASPNRGTRRYPVHLLDALACTPAARDAVAGLISESLHAGQPVHLHAKETLDASLLAGRTRLLREKDPRPRRDRPAG